MSEALAERHDSEAARRKETRALVREVVASGEDFEWYPSTPEIIECVQADMRAKLLLRDCDPVCASVLDCGAGDGRVLDALTTGRKYAIEKSASLIGAMDRDVFVIGTDFDRQTLLDKGVDFIFSNPPYSRFSEWAVKIIREANAKMVYLVIPERWESDVLIAGAIEDRGGEASVIGRFDFLSADRAARARVHVVCVRLVRGRDYYRHGGIHNTVDPFDLWFDEHFKVNASTEERSEYQRQMDEADRVRRDLGGAGELVSNSGLVHVLEQLYHRDLGNLMSTYQRLGELDGELLRELEININGVKAALRLKVASLKDVYWRELFDNLKTITDRLTSATRRKMLERLTSETTVDFSADNSHAVVMWALKNANHYYETQLVDLVEKMVDRANIELYRSNQTTFGDEMWRYGRRPDALSHYKLDYRVVLHEVGGLCVSQWSFEHERCGLARSAMNFIDDVRAVATNIGFDTYGLSGAGEHSWHGGCKVSIMYRDINTGELDVLLEARAFKNGNLHVKFNQAFIRRLNVEFGRLKGWLKCAQQAAFELDVSVEEAEAAFASNARLTVASLPRLLCAA